jgi:hypothetical protein
MDERIQRVSKPRCFLIYALAPEGMSALEANRAFNQFIADPALPLPIFHDHFIGQPGGLAIFFVDGPSQRDALAMSRHLAAWSVQIQPLIFSYSPAAFDEQIAFTLRAYRTRLGLLRAERGPPWQSSRRPRPRKKTRHEDGSALHHFAG